VKTIKMYALPQCNFCDRPAAYDAPTLNGSWAHMCPLCLLVAGGPATTIEAVGSELVQMTDEEKALEAAIARHPAGPEAKAARKAKAREINDAIQSGDWSMVEDLVGDGDITEWI
jgi:hypothetical protein